MDVNKLLGDLTGKLKNKSGEEVCVERLRKEKKHIGLYFSAHWCPPCRTFTPKLIEWYGKQDKCLLEIIFISSDKDSESFDEYYKEMPWLALDFKGRCEKDKLCDNFGITGIPTLVFLDLDDNGDKCKIEKNGRARVVPSK